MAGESRGARRRIPLARMELGAGAAAAVIGLLTFPTALLAPLYLTCSGHMNASGACVGGHEATVSLLSTAPDGGVWALLIALLVFTLIGAAGALRDALRQPQVNASLFSSVELILLWGATLLLLAICALGSRGPLGLLYLPSTLALVLAAYVALLRRLAARRAAATTEGA